MSKAVLKLKNFSGTPDLVLPAYSELQARLQKRAEPVMILPPVSGSAGY
jgi:hypothetical protein